MLKNYLLTALRSIKKNKVFSILHLLGLSIGLSLSFIMLLIVQHEFSFDIQHKKLDRIYRVYTDIRGPNLKMFSSPYPLAEKLENSLLEVEKTANIFRIRSVIEINDNKIPDVLTYSAESDIFDILTIPVISGQYNSPLSHNSVIISESFANTWFPSNDALGKVVTVRNMGIDYSLTVSAIMQDFPETSSLRCDIIVPAILAKDDINKRYKYRGDNIVEKWTSVNWLETYVLLHEGTDFRDVNKKVRAISSGNAQSGPEMIYNIEPYSGVHLNSNYDNWKPDTVSKNNVVLFLVISTMILLIACINYAILVNFQFYQKCFEIGIRKVFGADKKDILLQLLTESLLYSIITIPSTMLMIALFNNYFAELLNVTMPSDYFLNLYFILAVLLITLLSGIIPVLFTALKYSSMTPGLTFNFNKPQTIKHAYGQKLLLTVQLTTFICLIFVSITVYKQIDYFKNRDLGFSTDNVILVNMGANENKIYNTIKSELLKSSEILYVGAASNLPPASGGAFVDVPSNDPAVKVSSTILNIDIDMPKALGMDLLYNKLNMVTDTRNKEQSFIINESAWKSLQAQESYSFNNGNNHIVGVVSDFNYFSLERPQMPVLMQISEPGRFEYMIIKYYSTDIANILKTINVVWQNTVKHEPDIMFYDEYFSLAYKNEYKFASVITHATVFSFITATLGLLGLALFTVKNKTHEIKIRRILGANIFDINKVILKQFVYIVIAASVAGTTAGLYLIDDWLYGFYYRITPGIAEYSSPLLITSGIVSLSIFIFTAKLVFSKRLLTTRYE